MDYKPQKSSKVEKQSQDRVRPLVEGFLAELGRRAGKIGEKVRLEKVGAERRRQIGLKAVQTRWKKKYPGRYSDKAD